MYKEQHLKVNKDWLIIRRINDYGDRYYAAHSDPNEGNHCISAIKGEIKCYVCGARIPNEVKQVLALLRL